MSYRTWQVIFTVFSFIVSNAGLSAIIKVSVPVLSALYPIAIVLVLLTLTHKSLGARFPRVYFWTVLLVGIASGALLYANGNLELAINTLFFNEDGGMVAKLSDSSNVLPLSGHSASRSTFYFWMNRSAIWMMITAASWVNLSLPRQRHKEPV